MKSNENCIMVCVTQQVSCARLIEAGAKIANQESKALIVVSVISKDHPHSMDILNTLYETVEKHNANMNVYFNDSAIITTAAAAKKFNADLIITGFPGVKGSGFIGALHEIVPDIPITMIDEDMTEYKINPFDYAELEKIKASLNLIPLPLQKVD